MVCSVSGEIPKHPYGAGDRFVERRSVPRFPMIVDIEDLEPIQRTKLTAQLAEIGANGCYVCVTTPFQPSTATSQAPLCEPEVACAFARV